MANTSISPNMNLVIPTVSVDPGPDWANNINASLSILDQHNHASGSGVQITQAGIFLSPAGTSLDSLTFNTSNAYGLRSVRFVAQSAALALATDLGCLYEAGVDLYYNDGSGNQVRITQGGSVAGASGTITGLPSGTASAAYSAGTFIFQSATNTPANVDGGSFIFRNATANSKGLTLAPPNAMAANYSLTLPALPGSQSFLTVDVSGNIAAYASISAGIVGSNIAANTISGSNITNTNSITGNQIVGALTLATSLAIASGYTITPQGTTYKTSANLECFVLGSGTSFAGGLRVIRGNIAGNGTIISGEGFTVSSHPSAGNYVITYTIAFSDAAAVSAILNDGAVGYIAVNPPTAGNCQIVTFAVNTTPVDRPFSFVVVGAI